MNTAQLRDLAWQAYAERDYARAADLYAQAIAAYPKFNPQKNGLAARDIQLLNERLAFCREAQRIA